VIRRLGDDLRHDAVIVDARRTPICRRGGALAAVPPVTLTAAVLRALGHELGTGVGPGRALPDDVVWASSRPSPGNLARIAALESGLGQAVPGATVDRQCGGGLEAVRLAAALIGSGQAEIVLAGGVDSASLTDAADGVREGPSPQAPFTPAGHPDPGMGEAADELADRWGISRERQDSYAARSYERAAAARSAGVPMGELVPVGSVLEDDRLRLPGIRTLGRLRPAFPPPGRDGTVTPGNACGIADGAAGVTLISGGLRGALGVPGLRVVATAAVGIDPALPGLGSLEAARVVLDRAGVTVQDLATIEVVEAFAAQVLALTEGLGLTGDDGGDELDGPGPLVCPDGGAIALGHPWGASGALLLVRLFDRLVRRGQVAGRLGLATCAVAGGQGVAVLVETVT
jgi:acetyl-CoA C-acetyltransferase